MVVGTVVDNESTRERATAVRIAARTDQRVKVTRSSEAGTRETRR